MTATTFHFEAIGTHWRITLPEELAPSVGAALTEKILARIDLFDVAYSRFRDDSLVAAMAKNKGVYKLPPDGPPLFLLYERAYRLTNGMVTPLIGSVMEEAGYDKEYSLTPKALHAPKKWDEVLSFDGISLTLREPALLDVGAAGKGYLIDIVGNLLEAEGIHSYVIDAGGDIIHRHSGGETLRVGLEHPLDTTKVIGTVELGNESICGSAGNRRAWDKYTHIINPQTLASPTEILATWVVAETTMLADMLATCLFFVPPETLTEEFSFEYIILHHDFSVTYSPKAGAEFF